MAFGHLKWLEFATTSINTHSYIFAVLCVWYSTSGTLPEAERKAGKQHKQHFFSVWAWVTQVARFMAIYKYILYLIEELHDAYTDNSGEKSSPVYNSTALTERLRTYPSSHRVTATGQ